MPECVSAIKLQAPESRLDISKIFLICVLYGRNRSYATSCCVFARFDIRVKSLLDIEGISKNYHNQLSSVPLRIITEIHSGIWAVFWLNTLLLIV